MALVNKSNYNNNRIKDVNIMSEIVFDKIKNVFESKKLKGKKCPLKDGGIFQKLFRNIVTNYHITLMIFELLSYFVL